MAEQDRYVTLITSLPTPESLFRNRQTPLSRIRLDARLGMLRPEDAAELAQVEDIVSWDRLSLTMSDADVIARAERAMAGLGHGTLRTIVRERLEIRTAVAALRRRAHGDGPPPEDAPWGFGHVARRIRAAWTEPAFGLDRTMPWLPEADRLVRARDATALERLLLEVAWRGLKRREGEHLFDLPAVVIYVLKWHIVDRWTKADAALARRRLEGLVADALAAHGPVPVEAAAAGRA